MKIKKKLLFPLFSVIMLALLCAALTVGAATDDDMTATSADDTAPIAAPYSSFGKLTADIPMVKSGLRQNAGVCFTEADFKQALGLARFEAITVTSLPDARDGVLKLSQMKVQEGQTIRAEYLSSLTFVPTSASVSQATFTFTCDDYAGGAPMTCVVRILEKVNAAPQIDSAESTLAVSTQSGITVYGTLISLDPENDQLTYIVTAYPQKGTLSMEDIHSGNFKYTPQEGYTGKDSFSYVVRDACGNYTKQQKVTISVNKKKIDMDYEDMAGHIAYNAALEASANRWMLGTLSGNGMYFGPDQTVSRGEFVAMVMKAMNMTPSAGLVDSCFDDNQDIPVSVRPYVATAQEKGYVIGSFEGDGLYFHADAAVTRAEAAVILNRILDLSAPTSSPVFSDGDTVPVWAADAVSALYDAGILNATASGIAATAPLTRADTAMMLVQINSTIVR